MPDLNPRQQEAVHYLDGPLLVLAGAGSGKTRVITKKVVHLIEKAGISASHISAVTFTNKAAREMRGRIEEMLQVSSHGFWVGTFHGLAHRLLKAHWKEAGLPQGFQIMDSEDQQRAIRRLIREMGLDETQWSPREVQWYINARKDEGQRPQSIEDMNNPMTACGCFECIAMVVP